MADSSSHPQSRYAACAQRSQSIGWSSSRSTHLSTFVQELAMPVLSAGTDAVLAAETGSGKTICYLAPVIAQLLQLKQSHDASPSIRRCVGMQHGILCCRQPIYRIQRQAANSCLHPKASFVSSALLTQAASHTGHWLPLMLLQQSIASQCTSFAVTEKGS